MAIAHISAIGNPEFINVKPYNPLISECEIKVFYLGENRNHSYISKEVAIEMANSLPGCPIVGYFREDKQDFGDHGEQITFDGDGIHFKCLTKPYGFVAPDAEVWFQKFEVIDEYGRKVVREYLMTRGFLWTGQYPECQVAVDQGKPHSMELDEDTLDGSWTKNYNSNVEFFIINDALFSKLCILGDDVEPCFEESSVTAPQISSSFTVDREFKQTLYTMMQDLKSALQEGGQTMVKDFSATQDKFEKTTSAENEISTEGNPEVAFAKKEEEEKEAKKEEAPAPADDKAKEDEEEKKKGNFAKEDDEDKKKEDKEEKPVDDKDEKKEDEEKKKFSLLSAQHEELLSAHETLKSQFSALQAQFEELQSFKNQIEDEKKDNLIKSFYMLSDEDKKEVVENKAKYSLDEIESKLSVICVRKRVSFDLEEPNKEVEDVTPITTFNLNEPESSVPAWISAVKNTQKGRNI